ncbi:PHP domain-containing protein [Brachybacterium sp. GPGPB12]|uniref:PHP domain-containing protein n=1 Tax=Brachybacterium sp. GPGPB12 TaxID=3023517 RepID=UPI003134298F
MSTAGFVHLHTHSEYSDFDGLASVKRIVQAASDDDQGAVAITDHGRLASLWALRAACTAAGDVKPIPGMEAYIVVSGTRHNPGTIEVAAESDDLDAGGSSATGTKSRTKTKKYEHLTLLAATATGCATSSRCPTAPRRPRRGSTP